MYLEYCLERGFHKILCWFWEIVDLNWILAAFNVANGDMVG